MAIIGIIPARYASTRFPGKPLALIHGKPMIQWVYERSRKANLQKVVVATDDSRIQNAVLDFGGEVVMTSPHHQSGTERCAEVAEYLQVAADDILINIQGDEPFICAEAINQLILQFSNPRVALATLAKPFTGSENPENPNMVKVVRSQSGMALYFSRSAIPYYRNKEILPVFYKHIGIYGYRSATLQAIVKLPLSSLEDAEKLEQLRWLDNGYAIAVGLCNYESISIDTPEDLVRAEKMPLDI